MFAAQQCLMHCPEGAHIGRLAAPCICTFASGDRNLSPQSGKCTAFKQFIRRRLCQIEPKRSHMTSAIGLYIGKTATLKDCGGLAGHLIAPVGHDRQTEDTRAPGVFHKRGEDIRQIAGIVTDRAAIDFGDGRQKMAP